MSGNNPLKKLAKHGQSIWCDNVDRHTLKTGKFQKMIAEDGLAGVTSNPTIFEKAVTQSSDYDADLKRLAGQGLSPEEVAWSVIIKDIQDTADIFRTVYDRTKALDGYVSIEVSPFLANDTDGTIRQAKELWKRVDRPNVMIKIPATPEGIPAITETLGAGINVNVTLIFSLERYREVMEAHLKGLEKHAARGGALETLASVASFFVSRVDTAADKKLEEWIRKIEDAAQKESMTKLLGRTAIANSRLAYEAFEKVASSDRFKALRSKGAQVQRPLWASTSTKNKNYRDVVYVEELIGKNTVNTLPPATIDAFRDHGKAQADTIKKNLKDDRQALDSLRAFGIKLDEITHDLELAGVKSFSDSFSQLIAAVKSKEHKIGAKAS